MACRKGNQSAFAAFVVAFGVISAKQWLNAGGAIPRMQLTILYYCILLYTIVYYCILLYTIVYYCTLNI